MKNVKESIHHYDLTLELWISQKNNNKRIITNHFSFIFVTIDCTISLKLIQPKILETYIWFFRWVQTGSLKTASNVSSLSWNLEGTRLLTGGSVLQLWHERLLKGDEETSHKRKIIYWISSSPKIFSAPNYFGVIHMNTWKTTFYVFHLNKMHFESLKSVQILLVIWPKILYIKNFGFKIIIFWKFS